MEPVEKMALEKANEWVSNSFFDQESRNEVKTLIDNNDIKEITERFYKDLAFGTGGIRSIIGQGRNRINKYTVRRASQALALEVKKAAGNETPKIAVSYDSRKFSKEFAQEASGVFAANGIHVHIFERLNPVPMLSFSVRRHKAHAGVMVTASHNPPEYNGYKVYWSDGCQVTAPNDQNIISAYESLEDFSSIPFMNFEDGLEKGLIHWVGEDVENEYYSVLENNCYNPNLCKERGKDLKLVFTPIHGTGLRPCQTILEKLGFTSLEIVKEQAEPDHRFPTVKVPNPEMPEALSMAVDLLKATNSHLAFGTDPDTDRLGVTMIKDGEVVYLNGNQIGVLMLHYILTTLKERNQIPSNPYFVKTIVTTPLQKKIAENFGVESFDTLTGFKWICGLMNQLEKEQPEKNFLFATEESFGYLPHAEVRDKDGVAAVSLMAEVALWYHVQGMDLLQGLEKIYEEYGFSDEELMCLNYYGKEGQEKIGRIMDTYRKNPPKEIAGDLIQSTEDYEIGTITNHKKSEEFKLDFPKSNVLAFNLDSGDRVCLRPSGTEPKIKFYIMVNVSSGSISEKKVTARKKIEKILTEIQEVADKA